MGPLYILAGVALTWTAAWRLMRYWSVYLHELGHAAAVLILGGEVRTIRLNRDGSGLVEWSDEVESGFLGRTRHRGVRIGVLLAGYNAGGVVAVAAAVATRYGDTVAMVVLWAIAAACAASVLDSRGWYAVLAAVSSTTLAVVAALGHLPGAHVLAVGACTAASGSLHDAWMLHRGRATLTSKSDPGQLADITAIPVAVWTGAFLLLNVIFAAATAGAVLDLLPLPEIP